MAALNSKVDLCNLTLYLIGNKNTVNNIDTPKDDKEFVFAIWYDICRRMVLKTLIPNCATTRRVVSKLAITPLHGYSYVWEYPADCLRVLGIGDIDEKDRYNYVVESDETGTHIYTEDDFESGLPIRIIKDLADVSKMTDEIKLEIAAEMAKAVALPITQDAQKTQLILAQLPMMMMNATALNAQENRPIRYSKSRYRQARRTGFATAPFSKR